MHFFQQCPVTPPGLKVAINAIDKLQDQERDNDTEHGPVGDAHRNLHRRRVTLQ